MEVVENSLHWTPEERMAYHHDGALGRGRRQTTTSIPQNVLLEDEEVVEEALQPAYFTTYEGLAKSLSEMEPILSLYGDKLNIGVKIMYADKQNQTRMISTRALLVDVLDSTVRLDRQGAR